MSKKNWSPETTSKSTPNTRHSQPSVSAPNPKKASKPKQPAPTASRTPPVPKILFIGDSISGHADINVLANATQSNIVTARAYSAVFDDVSNKGKKAAYYPNKNFLQVVPSEVVKESFEHLIIQTGSVDISNLKTEVNPAEHIDYFKQETIMSAKNIFDSSLLALERQPALKSIVILKQTPRYDPLDTDPLSLKPALSLLFNNTIMELWMKCPMKEKI